MKNTQKIILALLTFSLLPAFAMAEFKISDYKYFKNLTLQDCSQKDSGEMILCKQRFTGNFSFKIDKEIYKNANQFFTDIRIIDQNNSELPFVISKKLDQTKNTETDKVLEIVSKKSNTYILDFGTKPKYHKNISIITNSFDFSRVVDIYGSNLSDSRWEKLNLDKKGELVAVVPGNNDKNISFKYTNYRYLKVIFSGEEGVLDIENFTVKENHTETVAGEKVSFELEKTVLKSINPKEQKFIFTSEGQNLPIDSLVIHTAEREFSRNIRILASNNKDAKVLENSKRYDKNTDYWKEIYRGNFSEATYTDEQIFKIKDNKKYYLVVINNADNKALTVSGATATRFFDTVYLDNLDFRNNSYRVFYGNIFAKRPSYDLRNLKAAGSAELKVSAGNENKLYMAPVEKLGEKSPSLIYIFIGLLVLILFWFVYKIMRETGNKDGGEKVDVIDKL